MKINSIIKWTLSLVLVALFSLNLTGCCKTCKKTESTPQENTSEETSKNEHPSGEHPSGENQTSEHPSGEHPTGD
jgi:hypothetical protein